MKRPSQVRQQLEEDGARVDDVPTDEGPDSPRQTYNFAPGCQGIVYRADILNGVAGRPLELKPNISDARASRTICGDEKPVEHDSDVPGTGEEARFKLQSMKWGLVPSWTSRNPDYRTMVKTINCRDDSLATGGGIWATIKHRKRCIVIAQGFYEWLKSGTQGIPHYVKRKDGRLMCFAGLWDCVHYEGLLLKPWASKSAKSKRHHN